VFYSVDCCRLRKKTACLASLAVETQLAKVDAFFETQGSSLVFIALLLHLVDQTGCVITLSACLVSGLLTALTNA